MAFYGQKNYSQKMGNGPYTIAEIGCFLTAFCNLLQKYGVNVDPASLNNDFIQRGIYLNAPEDGAGVKDDLGWNSVTAYDGQIKVTGTVDHGTARTAGWPSSNNAIVKFYYQSISQPTVNGKPNMITHFCLVADQNAHTIVDSWDGVIKSPGAYGDPVAWSTYDSVVPQAVTPPAPPAAVSVPATPAVPAVSQRPGTPYKFAKGDSFYTIAPRFQSSNPGLTAADLMAYNGINDTQAHDIPVGFVIYIPPATTAAAQAPATSGYTIEALPTPKTYHITRDPSANKWSFGNVKQWTDFKPNGSTPVNTDVTIAAVATVVIGKETAAYYMDSLAYANGQVINTIGYNWSDLAEGAYEAPTPPAPTPTPAPAPATPVVTPAAPAPTVTDTGVSTNAAGQLSPNAYKTTYETFPQPKIYIANKTVSCPECDGKRSDHELQKNQGVSISGTFIKGQVLYGRPTGAVKSGLWFGVPMDALDPQETVFSTKTTLAEKKALGAKISLGEKLTVLFASIKTSFSKIKK